MRKSTASPAKGSMQGVLKNDREMALPDANVVITQGPVHSDLAAMTSEDGTFEFANLTPGQYLIKAYANTTSDVVPVRVYPGKTAFVEIWLSGESADEPDNVVPEW